MKYHYKKHKGFTLVEVIISFALFAILMTPIYSMLISTMNTNKKGEVKQIASLHGQEIFEEIKSGDVVAVKDAHGNISISKIGNIDILATNTGEKTFDDGYKATVTITKNTSITLDKGITSDEDEVETSDFNLILSGSSSPITVKLDEVDESLSYGTADSLKLVINTQTRGNKKVIVIKDSDNNDILTKELTVDDEDINNQIKIIFNFDQYEASSGTDMSKLKEVKVSVYNQDKIPLNLCLQKSTDLDVNIDTKLGTVRVYDNRSGNMSEVGELYDINVKITQRQGNETNTIFTGETSQNINVN